VLQFQSELVVLCYSAGLAEAKSVGPDTGASVDTGASIASEP